MGWIERQDNHWDTRRTGLGADSRWAMTGVDDGRGWSPGQGVEFRVESVAGTRHGMDKESSRSQEHDVGADDCWDATWNRRGDQPAGLWWDGSIGVDWKTERAEGEIQGMKVPCDQCCIRY